LRLGLKHCISESELQARKLEKFVGVGLPASIRPAIFLGMVKLDALAREYKMLVAEHRGRMSISKGSEFVRPLSLW